MAFPRSAVFLLSSSLALCALCASSVAGAAWPSPQGLTEAAFGRAVPEVRRQTLSSLADASPRRALPLIQRGLVDATLEVRVVAAELAVSMPLSGPQVASIASLVEPWLASREAVERALAAELLAPSTDRESLRRLVPLLTDYDPQVRMATARALASVPSDVVALAAEALTLAMNDSELEVRRDAARSLGLLGEPSGVLPIVGALRDADAEVRVEAATALAAIGDDRGLDAVVSVLDDPDPRVVSAAVRALALHPSASRQSALISIAERSPFDDAALEAARTLSLQPGPRLTELFVALLQRTDARSALVPALQDPSSARRDWTECLARAVGPTLRACAMLHFAQGGDVEPALRARAELRIDEAQLMEAARGRFSLALMVRALRLISTEGEQLSSGSGQAALQYLLSLDELPAEAQAPLLQALQASARSVETAALLLRLLLRLPPSASLDLDPAWLDSSSARLRFMAARAVTHHGLQGKFLRQLLTHPQPSVSRGAIAALARQASPAQVAVVLDLLEAGSNGLQAELARALDGIDSPLSKQAESQLRRALLQSRWALSSGGVAGLRAREQLLGALGRWGSAELVAAVLPELVPADRRTLVQALEYNARAASLLVGFFDDPSHRVRALSFEGAARAGQRLPPEPLASGPHFLRAAWWRSLQAAESQPLSVAQAQRGDHESLLAHPALARDSETGVGGAPRGEGAEALRHDVSSWEEACSSEHVGLRAAAWGLAAFRGQSCASRATVEGLRPQQDLRIRRAVAHALSLRLSRTPLPAADQEAWTKAVRRCVVYELDSQVARICRRLFRDAFRLREAPLELAPGGQEAPRRAMPPERRRLHLSWTQNEAKGVPFPLWQGDLLRVVVSDRAGEVLLPAGEFIAGDAALGY